MKKYFKSYSRNGNAIFFGIFGAAFVAVGIIDLIWIEGVALGAACIVFGALLGVLPQFVIFSRYGLNGDRLCYRKLGVPQSRSAASVGAAVISVYDEYGRGRGYQPVVFETKGGTAYVPSLSLFEEIDENELDLCDTRSRARIAFRKKYVTDMTLDFDFLREFYRSSFGGRIYILDTVYATYKPAFDELFCGDERVVIYDRIPKNGKKL